MAIFVHMLAWYVESRKAMSTTLASEEWNIKKEIHHITATVTPHQEIFMRHTNFFVIGKGSCSFKDSTSEISIPESAGFNRKGNMVNWMPNHERKTDCSYGAHSNNGWRVIILRRWSRVHLLWNNWSTNWYEKKSLGLSLSDRNIAGLKGKENEADNLFTKYNRANTQKDGAVRGAVWLFLWIEASYFSQDIRTWHLWLAV